MPKKTKQLTSLDALNEQILAAAEGFSNTSDDLSELLKSMLADVSRANSEALEIFPVKHHSPASALHLIKRLQQNPPKVIFMEGCEDLGESLESLKHCRFPVALQAFAAESEVFPAEVLPLNLVLPLTEFSAEYQAIAYSMQHPETELVFVDRSSDHVYQWLEAKRLEAEKLEAEKEETEKVSKKLSSEDIERKGANLHVGAVGLRIGNMEPSFDDFMQLLLKNARVKHYDEWWTQYVEGPTLGSSYDTYRQVFFLIASLLRRLGISEEAKRSDEMRERYMWSRMNQYLKDNKLDAKDALYICGAIHAVSDIPEFGSQAKTIWQIPERTSTPWLYGIVPSSYVAIEGQFGMPIGEISLAQRMWQKALKAEKLKAFKIEIDDAKAKKAKKPAKATTKAPSTAKISIEEDIGQGLSSFLTRPPEFIEEDNEQLLAWCSSIVNLARKNGYTASTADSIAIYQTSKLLANLRDRPHPSPYDFQDAAITCLEKDRVPKKRNIQRLTEILLGGDKLGRVGYDSLPPLAKDVYTRLEPLGIDLESTHIQRALMDFKDRPELLTVSDLLWKLHYLNIDVRPIMGERHLGHKPLMESWDIAFGKHQTSIINLAYEAMTVEQVLELRLRKQAYGDSATCATALKATEDSILYLKRLRFTTDLGIQATQLLQQETGAADAPEIFQRIRHLIQFYRRTGLPDWIKDFVKNGYQHYATLLPQAFNNNGTTPAQLSAMLSFIFTQEALAFSMGCERSQLLISLAQVDCKDPAKTALLWAAQWVLNIIDEEDLRENFHQLLENPLLLPVFPDYVAGFLLALEFSPRISRLAVELLSHTFASLPNEVLIPWLPKLVVALRPLGPQLTQSLLKEASLAFPQSAKELESWEFPWQRKGTKASQKVNVVAQTTKTKTALLLHNYGESVNAHANRLGLELTWAQANGEEISQNLIDVAINSNEIVDIGNTTVTELLDSFPAAVQTHTERLRKK